MSEAMHIGALRTRLTLETSARAADGGGGSTVAWNAVASMWADVRATTGGEGFEADRVAGRVSHTIVIRHLVGVTAGMRFRTGARVFDIRAVLDPDNRRRWLRCLVEERDL